MAAEAKLLPGEMRKKYCQWGAAAFPSGVPGKENTTYAGMDVWVVPSTSKHKKEAVRVHCRSPAGRRKLKSWHRYTAIFRR